MDRFSEQLKGKQGKQSDADFAARLGVTQSYWTRIKLGQRPITLTIARAAVSQWPELEAIYIDGVRSELHGDGEQSHTKRAG